MSLSGWNKDQFRSKTPVSMGFMGSAPTSLLTAFLLILTFESASFSADNFLVAGDFEQKPVVHPAVNESFNWPGSENPLVTRWKPATQSTAVAPVVMSSPWLPRLVESTNHPFLRLVDGDGDKPDKKDDDKNDQKTPPEPDISKPGADFGDYPNSAFTLPKGRVYLEITPISYQGKDRHNSGSNSYNYLFRYGVTDDVEFRLTGSGLTTVFDPGATVVGFAPLIIDTKIHLWDDQMDKLIPAASFEAFIQTNLASPTFQSGFQPSINMNLDFPFTKDTNVEMTFGYTGVQDAVYVIGGERFIPRLGHNIPTLSKANLNVNLFSFQWALEQQVTEKFQVFLQGYYNGDVFRQSAQGRVVGLGYFYQFNKRATFFNSYNAGLDPSTPNFSSQVGFAFAF